MEAMPPRNPQGKPDESNGLTRLPLSGLTVVDLTRALAGPTCTRHLADWGADVISVHQPGAEAEDVSGNRDISDFQNLHRNKRTISIDLKSPEGHAVFMRLVNRADVLVENMRPSVKHRLKIAWEDVHAVNPRLVYASVSGFGQDGPYADRAGVDQIAQGMGGLMSITGEPGQGPMRVGVPIADLSAGNLMAHRPCTAGTAWNGDDCVPVLRPDAGVPAAPDAGLRKLTKDESKGGQDR